MVKRTRPTNEQLEEKAKEEEEEEAVEEVSIALVLLRMERLCLQSRLGSVVRLRGAAYGDFVHRTFHTSSSV